jgi:hypothetical protein
MKLPLDHDLRIWGDAPTYVALHPLAADDDRAVSEYVRHLINVHLKQVSLQARYVASPALGAERDGEGRTS